MCTLNIKKCNVSCHTHMIFTLFARRMQHITVNSKLQSVIFSACLTLKPADNLWGMLVYTIWACMATLGDVQ